jgi:hypothetical protein
MKRKLVGGPGASCGLALPLRLGIEELSGLASRSPEDIVPIAPFTTEEAEEVDCDGCSAAGSILHFELGEVYL